MSGSGSETPIPCAVIGAGSWGTAVAIALAAGGNPVRLWGRNADHIAEMRRARRNARYLECAEFPPTLEPVADLAEAVRGCPLIFFVVPSAAMRETAAAVQETGAAEPGAVLISCTKGIERGTGLRMTQVLADCLPGHPVAVLSGPNHAEEIAKCLPAAAVIGCEDDAAAARAQAAFADPSFRVYTNSDVAGIEWGAAAKNVFAIAAGIAEGLGLGDNAKASLVTRGLAELARLGGACGGRPETFLGLSGVGDLIVTCYSQHSRNGRVGRALGQGESLAEIMAKMPMIAEGVPNTASIYESARQAGVRTPIIDQIYAILYEGKPPKAALQELLNRDQRPETD